MQKWNINVTPDGRFPEAQLALSSSILWLKFLPLAMKKDQIGAALEQFGVTEFLVRVLDEQRVAYSAREH